MEIENVFRHYSRKIGSNNRSEKNKRDLKQKRKLIGKTTHLPQKSNSFRNFAQQTLQINDMRKGLEDDYATKHKTVQKAYSEANKELSQNKVDKEKVTRENEDLDKQKHIEYNTGNNFYTENTETCQSQLAPHRVIPYHWKGMNEHQRTDILHEQDKQRKEAESIKKFQKDEDKLYALQAEVILILVYDTYD